MKKGQITLRNAVIGIAIIFILALLFQWYVTKQGTAKQEAKEENLVFSDSEAIALRDMAISEDNPELCKKIVDSDIRGFCISQIAVKRNDGSLCNELGINRNGCLLMLAEASGNEEICKGLVEERAEESSLCYRTLAVLTNTPEFCSMMPEDENNDVSICLHRIAFGTKNKALCEKITDSEIKDSCINGYESSFVEAQ